MATKLNDDEIDDLLYFARTGDKEELGILKDTLCKRGNLSLADVLQAARDEHSGNGVLHMAAANGHYVIISELCEALSISSPQNPTMLSILNAQNSSGNTALHWAALNGHLDSVKILLEQGSDPTITNQRGHDAVYEAELNNKEKVVEWVLKEGGEGLEEGVAGETTRRDVEVDGEEDSDKMDEDVEAEDEQSKMVGEGLSQMSMRDGAVNS